MNQNPIGPAEQGAIAARVGLIAPLVGIVLMIVLSTLVNVIIGIIVGAVAVIVLVPITHRILRRRRDGPS